jgi:hypothetical protein
VGSQPTLALETPQRSEDIAKLAPFPAHLEAQAPPELTWPEMKIRRGGGGETLAVLALLLPLLAQGLVLAFNSWAIAVAVSWATIIVTALILAVDAALLGPTDLQGNPRAGPVALFVGMVLLWIVCYPVVFFRRRHFGRPNLGILAILVAVFFVAAPFVQDFVRFGVVAGGPPTCNSREIVAMVDDMIRKSPIGPSVLSISGHREVRYDAASQIRTGQCQVKTQTETIPVTFSVKLLNRTTGVFQVEVEPVIPEDPPSCTDPEVIAILERIIREGPNGPRLKSIARHQEIRYDRETKTRHGRCQATLQGWTGNVAYRVYWLNRKTGQFQVEIEP